MIFQICSILFGFVHLFWKEFTNAAVKSSSYFIGALTTAVTSVDKKILDEKNIKYDDLVDELFKSFDKPHLVAWKLLKTTSVALCQLIFLLVGLGFLVSNAFQKL